LLKEDHFSHVIILAGTNDLSTKSAEAIFKNLQTMYAMVKAHGAQAVCVTLPGSMFVRLLRLSLSLLHVVLKFAIASIYALLLALKFCVDRMTMLTLPIERK